jgi:type 2 lantibiotic biosynthesis protein LanM
MARKPSNGRLALALTRAIDIDERIAELGNDARAPVGARRRAQARRAIREWKQQPPYTGDGASFERSLANVGVTERELERLLTPSITPRLRRRVRESTWWRTYSKLARAQPPTRDDLPRGPACIAETLIASGIEALGAHIAACRGVHRFDLHACLRAARADVAAQLDVLLEGVFRLELRIAELGGLLDDSPERDDAVVVFERLWCSPASRKRLFSRYPLLLAEVERCVELWLQSTIEFVERFREDAAGLSSRLFDGRPLQVRGWCSGAGDRHGGGRCALIVELDGGARVVYKPHSLATDEGVGRFVAWINAHVPGTPLRVARVVDRTTHGWAEFIEHRELTAAGRAHDYYERQGKWLALFYVLHANDLHCDNAIACGDEPIYVDLETLFHPTHGMFQAGTAERACGVADVPPATVNDTFILPIARHLSTSDGTGYFDVSVMTSSIRQSDGLDRGTMKHRASFAGRVAVASDHVDAICAGFASVYEAVAARREALASDDGLPAMFGEATFRIVVRPTTLYAQMIDHARHPDNLADALERRALFSRIHVDGRPDLNACVRREIADLERGDIPRFVRGFDDECIGDARSGQIDGLRLPSARSIMRHRLERLCRGDLEAQQALIRVMLIGDDGRGIVAVDTTGVPRDDARVAVDIADGLLSHSVVAGPDRYWICQALLDGGLAMHAPGILNLYSGQLGVALMLGTAAAALDRRDYADAALQTVATVRRWSDGGRRGFTSCGVFNGAMGYAYVLANLGALLHRRDLVDEAIALASSVPGAWRSDGLDVVDGAAGCILFLANLQASLGTDPRAAPLTPVLASFAERVVAAAAIRRTGIAWHAPGAPDGLTGFANGAAGYAAALAVAGQVLCRPDYSDLARQAIAFENSHYDASVGHWRDLRPGVADGPPLCAWCNGAAGILLGRWIASRAGLDAPDVHRDMIRAVRVLHERRSRHDSLCHGDAGNHDILDDVGSRVGAASTWCMHVGHPSLDLSTSPGLLVGAAGIAHAALRRAFPRRVPSVLALEVAPV